MENILKNSFINAVESSDISTVTILTMLLVVSILGIYIFFIYRLFCNKTFYSKSFAISLVAVAIITSIIICAIKSSIVISLGMVGALSIVRFRTPLKEPLDLSFMFWSLAVGIICGAGMYEVAILGSLMLTIVIIVLVFVPNLQTTRLMVVKAENDYNEEEILKILEKYSQNFDVRSRIANDFGTDIIIEIKTKSEKELIDEVLKAEKVKSASLMTHDGELV